MKQCGRCKAVKPADGFYGDRTKGDGLSSRCKDCERERKRRRVYVPHPRKRRTPEEVREYQRGWRAQNLEKLREYSREYHKRTYEAHPRKRRSPIEQREANLARGKRWREKDPERTRALARAKVERYRRRNSEKVREQRVAQDLRRRAREQPVSQADREYVAVLRRDPCSYCGSDGVSTMDHVEPVFRGGSAGWGNLTAACRSCNSSKGTGDLLLFLLRRLR